MKHPSSAIASAAGSAWAVSGLGTTAVAGNTTGVGQPLSETLDPFQLEVHHAITVPGSEALPMLPPYLERDHDHELRRRIARALAEGRSTMVVLVGGSSTGKTRACWEALHTNRDGQRLLAGEHRTQACEATPRMWRRTGQGPPQTTVPSASRERGAAACPTSCDRGISGARVLRPGSNGLSGPRVDYPGPQSPYQALLVEVRRLGTGGVHRRAREG
jgi:hypothetical protein